MLLGDRSPFKRGGERGALALLIAADRLMLIITSTGVEVFRNVNIDDLE